MFEILLVFFYTLSQFFVFSNKENKNNNKNENNNKKISKLGHLFLISFITVNLKRCLISIQPCFPHFLLRVSSSPSVALSIMRQIVASEQVIKNRFATSRRLIAYKSERLNRCSRPQLISEKLNVIQLFTCHSNFLNNPFILAGLYKQPQLLRFFVRTVFINDNPNRCYERTSVLVFSLFVSPVFHPFNNEISQSSAYNSDYRFNTCLSRHSNVDLLVSISFLIVTLYPSDFLLSFCRYRVFRKL